MSKVTQALEDASFEHGANDVVLLEQAQKIALQAEAEAFEKGYNAGRYTE